MFDERDRALISQMISTQEKTNELLQNLLNIFLNYDKQYQNETFGKEVIGEQRPDLL
jgi:hypothetical protein